jgi:hypothetical protein
MKSQIANSWFILLAVFLTGSLSADVVNVAQLKCDNAFCEEIAEKVDYKHERLVRSVSLRTAHYSLDIPDKPIRRIVASEDDVIVYYRDNQLLIISEKRVPDIENLDTKLAHKFPEIVFTKTSRDAEPKEVSEAVFWKVAMLQKQFYFSKANKVTYFENGDVSYFVSDSSAMGFSGSAMVSTPRIKEVFLQIDAEKMDFETFERVVSSVKNGG